ncbi:putative bolA-like protein [Neolecta irregularis DAH-3]|uniref:Putative bolA-like protein n=1 Tax=Neolecta irregularis (strain DAH-3) TaxID=1198029 RepID=A0A1U7LH43_NEOID|nr:putative bolA-like protein [Neolecta irregularis DAH-3]|eukprot:OLL21976.1 putative bolA-like protein [Neolecta irregularis DAH-3]
MLRVNRIRMLFGRRYISSSTPNEGLTKGGKAIYEKLSKEFQPRRLRVLDISGGCGQMYSIDIASTKFEGLNRVEQHRLVNDLLKDEIKGFHGLQLKTEPAF